MNILLATNKFQQFAGAEVVTLEIAEYFRGLGHDVTIVVWFARPPMTAIARKLGVAVVERPQTLNAFDYDLVWAQHHLAPVLRYELTAGCRERTFFAWRHLSVVGHFELPGLVLQDLICDLAYAVSNETSGRLIDLGMPPENIILFPNPAPASFHHAAPRRNASGLSSLLVVSNHAPAEVRDALALLAAEGVEVRHVGRNGEGQTRVTPPMIRRADAILSIGKSVQYALCGRTPVYVYDQFGGPGYLDAGNFEAAAFANFSGRCCGRTVPAQTIAHEIQSGFAAARDFVASMPDAVLENYRLEPYLDALLGAAAHARPNAARMTVLEANRAMLGREQAFCTGAGVTYRGHHAMRRRLEVAGLVANTKDV